MQYVTISVLEVLNNVTKYLCLKCLKQYNKMTGETISQKTEANILSNIMGMPWSELYLAELSNEIEKKF